MFINTWYLKQTKKRTHATVKDKYLCFADLCYRLNVCVPHKCICWNLTPKLMILGDGNFGRCLSHWVCAIMNKISALENSLAVTWLGLLSPLWLGFDPCSIPVWGTKILKAMWHKQTNKQTKVLVPLWKTHQRAPSPLPPRENEVKRC